MTAFNWHLWIRRVPSWTSTSFIPVRMAWKFGMVLQSRRLAKSSSNECTIAFWKITVWLFPVDQVHLFPVLLVPCSVSGSLSPGSLLDRRLPGCQLRYSKRSLCLCCPVNQPDVLGSNWMVPKEDWDWQLSPPNSEPNGIWPEALRNETVAVFEFE